MPSLASYRRRKAEIEQLKDDVLRLTADMGRAQDSIRYATRYMESLEKALRAANLYRQQAETMMRVWQQYVMDHYLLQTPTYIIKKDGSLETVEVPSCIKPKDVSEYVFRNDPKEEKEDGSNKV